jgi:signal transduction histidine kinase
MTVQAQSEDARVEALRAQLLRLQTDLADERRRGEQKDEFLAVVAHELRAPLGAILGWAHMLRRRGGEEELDRGLDVIEQSVSVQAKLIEDLLVMSRMTANRIRLDTELLDLHAVLDAAVESVRPLAGEKNIRLRKTVELPGPPVRGDATRLQQVLVNLLTNAVKFTPIGGDVDVALHPSRGWAVLTVTDTGVGIAPEFLPHVFDHFKQDPSAARLHGGLGLGLAIARHLVELHGGEIEAASEGESRGATFTVRLPLAESR